MANSPREHHDWISAFIEHTKHGEAPTKVYFWVAVATIAGALRRRVWIDQRTFKWYPNLYTLIVGPPGIIAKTTTADLGMNLLRQCPGVVFGPDVVTWQALFDAFNDVHEGIMYEGTTLEMSALTIAAGEFGNFLRPDDTAMVDQLVNIWDGKAVKKRTRMDGEQIIANPCLNLIGCTTPSWIAQNFPEYMIGGGFTSRLIFVYADEKARYVAYPFRNVPTDFDQTKESLIRDLEKIATLVGPVRLTDEAVEWGTAWYENFHKVEARQIDETLLGGYISRKQTLAHKVAMCLMVSRGDELVLGKSDLERAVGLLTELEKDMPKVYSRIGMSTEAIVGGNVVAFVKRLGGPVPFNVVFKYMHKTIPDVREAQTILKGLVEAGLIRMSTPPSGGAFFEVLP